MIAKSLTVLGLVAIFGAIYGQINNGSTRFLSADDINVGSNGNTDLNSSGFRDDYLFV